MSITVIALLVGLGIVLLLLEFLVVPGVTVAGIGGVLVMGAAVYLAYHHHGNVVGGYVLGGTVVALAVSLYFALRQKTWKKIALSTNVEGNVSGDDLTDYISVGDSAKAITRLAPIGKVMVNDRIVEGKSQIGYIDENTNLEVIKVLKANIIVKPKK